MKTEFYLYCVTIAVAVVLAADPTLARLLSSEGVDKRQVFYESTKLEQAAAAAKQASSYTNYNSYPGGVVYQSPGYACAPTYPCAIPYASYLPSGSNYQLSQQSSEAAAAAAAASRNEYASSNYGYGGLGGYPAIQRGGLGALGYPGLGSAQFYQQSSEAAAAAQASSQSLQIQQTRGGYYPIPPPQPYPVIVPCPVRPRPYPAPCPVPPAPICPPVGPIVPSFVPREVCDYVKQCKTVWEPICRIILLIILSPPNDCLDYIYF